MTVDWKNLSLRKIWRFILTPWSMLCNSLEFFWTVALPANQKIWILFKFIQIQFSPRMKCGHRFGELLYVAQSILKLWEKRGKTPNGVIAECGCWEGASTAKLGIIAEIISWKLIVFDSFEGLPPPITGDHPFFKTGDYSASLEKVKNNIRPFTNPDKISFVKGFFENTLPNSNLESIDVVFIDVDIIESTKTCIQYLYPKLKTDGFFFSHDSHLPSIVKTFSDHEWWKQHLKQHPVIFHGASWGLGIGRESIGYIKAQDKKHSTHSYAQKI